MTNILNISFLGSHFVPLFSFSPRCISKALQNIVRNACYNSIDPKSRKDFNKPSGIFDFQQTTMLLRSCKWTEPSNRDRFFRLENILVGCTPQTTALPRQVGSLRPIAAFATMRKRACHICFSVQQFMIFWDLRCCMSLGAILLLLVTYNTRLAWPGKDYRCRMSPLLA